MSNIYEIILYSLSILVIYLLMCIVLAHILHFIQYIIDDHKSKIVEEIVKENMRVQDNLIMIDKMIADISEGIPTMNTEWPFFDKLDEEGFNHMDTKLHDKINNYFSIYSALFYTVTTENDVDNNVFKHSIFELRKKLKSLKIISRYILAEYRLLSLPFREMMIIMYITHSKNDLGFETSEINDMMKYRFTRFNTLISYYNKK